MKENKLKIISFDFEKINEEKMRICMIDVNIIGVRVVDMNLIDLSHKYDINIINKSMFAFFN